MSRIPKQRSPLNKSQQELVLNNLGLAHWYWKRYFRGLAAVVGKQDMRQYALLFLCEAASTYEESHGKFSTWATCNLRCRFLDLTERLRHKVHETPTDYGYEEPAAEKTSESAKQVDDGSDVAGLMARLDTRTQTVLSLRYGIGDGQSLSQEETGRWMGLSKTRISQIEGLAFKLMRTPKCAEVGTHS